jgi:DNA-binding transcriptional regulator YiaG
MISWQRRSGVTIHLDGDRLRSLREANGLSQRAFAEQLGVTAAAVSSWETEARCPSLPQIERIQGILGSVLEEAGALVVEG